MRHKHVTTAVVPVLAGVAAVVLSASPAGAHVGGHVIGLVDGALHSLTGGSSRSRASSSRSRRR